ncbi:MAG: PorP/SprF family type IX secretion system membrane protein [Bacteroidetes bacterium]|nr:PorP/SprF family type IX secretion system membrane protein [Bacteroidota bacterium]
MKFIQKYYIVLLVLLFSNKVASAQDPNFSQFIASPLSINPALTSNGESSWRAMSNVRTQWVGIGSSYITQSLSVDGKLKKLDDDNYLGIGGMVIAEKAMDGIFKSTYININTAYHLSLDNKGNGLAVGLGYINNNTRIDFSQLSFDQQLSSIGFDRTLPAGEPSLSNATSFSSACAGIMYTYDNDNTFLNLGAAGYRFVKSNRSVLDDKTQYISPRYDIHADFGTALNDRVNLNVSAVHMIQNGTSNTSIGTSFGLVQNANDFNSEQLRMLNLGMFYKIGNAIIPYVGYNYNAFQFGFSYDVNVSSVKSGSMSARSFEISFMYRGFSSSNLKTGRYHSPF